MVEIGIFCLQNDFPGRQATLCFHVSIHLVVQAAFQLAALSGQFLRVDGYILVACRRSGDGNKTRHPFAATHFASTGADTAYAACLLAGTDLLHLNLDPELAGQYFDQLAEIDPFISDIVKDGFVTVALILHVADLHLQPQLLGDLTGANHGRLLARFCLLILLQIGRPGNAINPFKATIGLFTEVVFLHLQLY